MCRSHSYHGFSGHHHEGGRGVAPAVAVYLLEGAIFRLKSGKRCWRSNRDELKKELKGVEEEIKRIGSWRYIHWCMGDL